LVARTGDSARRRAVPSSTVSVMSPLCSSQATSLFSSIASRRESRVSGPPGGARPPRMCGIFGDAMHVARKSRLGVVSPAKRTGSGAKGPGKFAYMPTDSSVGCLSKSNTYLVHTIGAACTRKTRTSGARECGRPAHRIRRSGYWVSRSQLR
jgi:hypothetical protein